ncbi:unnamed protein product [Rotaria socialis]|uniref:Endoplasmic reticulum-Golgi intermediate compartment protein 3 n=1 Tax=Rotaria socialis TaxID=392032 RepID=A0A821QTD5_9BILA|nr:unnamed protein product [Rotaria socialis]CAF3336160.1 unnamed protein product [Rotaria socialis]CAF3379152.1 unnamed protein product [Rotaria socialis]CAF3444284.1 unnamed protein product [Rotaria socialis]CAF3677044.1 unnamed protein product [Rotaria socialis]
MSAQIKRFDAYAKTLDDFRVRTTSGGLVTISSTLIILIIFYIQLQYYLTTDIEQVLFVDTSRQEKMNITIDICYPVLPCSYLTIDAIDISGEAQTDIVHNLYKTRLDLDGKPIASDVTKVELQRIPKINATQESSTTAHACESCYGAESDTYKCCSTCDEVKAAYRTKGWSFDPTGVAQCIREGQAVGLLGSNENGDLSQMQEGCLVHGHLEVNKVAGNFHIAPGQSFQQHHVHIHSLKNIRLNMLNTTHYINHLSFGQHFPSQVNPLADTKQIANASAVLFHYYIKVVPSTYVFLNKTEIKTNQYSVTKHQKPIHNIADNNNHQLPGTFFTYEISAIMVKFVERQRSLAQFLTSSCAIIGGVFTVSSLIDAFLYRGGCLFRQKMEIGKAT